MRKLCTDRPYFVPKDYPRPQLVRNNWVNLNGIWDFRFDDENQGEKEGWYRDFPGDRKIRVPFSYETKLSGIGEEQLHENVWYCREFVVSETEIGEHRLFLHFEGCDFITKVWVNGQYAGSHRGGYSRFSFDVTDLVREGVNILTVKAEDSQDIQQPRGKQRWIPESYECWYVQTTGIWKTVWMEYVADIYFENIRMTPVLEKNMLDVDYTVKAPSEAFGAELAVEADISFQGEFVTKTVTAITSEHVRVSIDVTGRGNRAFVWGVRTWSPEKPDLYDISFRIFYKNKLKDEASSYFGMREIRIDGPNILLNGKPLYQRLILDQGYWKDSHLTPPGEEAVIEDIDKIHALGFNGLRKHQKTEDERFLYWCDVKGMLVWSEAAAAYEYSDHAVELFTKEWLDIVRQNYNHPSIITWTPFNESWGIRNVETDSAQQHFTEAIYHLTKSIDPYRPVVANDGWEHTVSDIITLHDYEESGKVFYERYGEHKEEILNTNMYHCGIKSAFANGFCYRGQPVMITEYGGIAFDSDDTGWGYGNKADSEEAFLCRFREITRAIRKVPYLCGFCYTQVSDVQQEINGLMDMDRKFKIDPEKIREIITEE